jgi:hypothetical protein
VLLSIFCSLTYRGVKLDRPALDTVRTLDLQLLQTETQQARERLQATTHSLLKQQQQEQELEMNRLLNEHRSRISQLSRQLDREMNNVVKGEFIGKRYRAIETRLTEAKAEEARLIDELSTRHANEREKLQDKVKQMLTQENQQINHQYKQELNQIQHGNYATDERVHHPMIASLVNTFKAVLGQSPTPLQLVFFFSIFLSLLMELGIIQAFESATQAIFPLLQVQQQSEMDQAILREKLNSEQIQDEMKSNATTEKIERRFRQVIGSAHRTANHTKPVNQTTRK